MGLSSSPMAASKSSRVFHNVLAIRSLITSPMASTGLWFKEWKPAGIGATLIPIRPNVKWWAWSLLFPQWSMQFEFPLSPQGASLTGEVSPRHLHWAQVLYKSAQHSFARRKRVFILLGRKRSRARLPRTPLSAEHLADARAGVWQPITCAPPFPRAPHNPHPIRFSAGLRLP